MRSEMETCQMIKIHPLANQITIPCNDIWGLANLYGRDVLLECTRQDCRSCKHVDVCVVAETLMPKKPGNYVMHHSV